MLLGYLLFQVMACWSLCDLCVGTSLTDSRESREEGEDGEVPIPFPEKVLNSVLGRLERSRHRQERFETVAAPGDPLNCNDPSETLPEYTETIQGVTARERSLRQLASQKHFPICLLERKIRRLNSNDYEYRPAYYEEVHCMPGFSDSNEICSSLGFSCVQWNKTIHLTRRRYTRCLFQLMTSDCWETKSMVIPAGCECMWPIHQLGDMKLHI